MSTDLLQPLDPLGLTHGQAMSTEMGAVAPSPQEGLRLELGIQWWFGLLRLFGLALDQQLLQELTEPHQPRPQHSSLSQKIKPSLLEEKWSRRAAWR